MPWDLFTKILWDLREIDFAGELALQNYNEPMMNDRIVEEYKIAHAVLPKARLTLYTNGDRLNPHLLGLLREAGVTRMRVTRYPPRQQSPTAASRAALAAFSSRRLGKR
jgi:MoaA/NifB/PqqE/SkfB family radical SAM enzyme